MKNEEGLARRPEGESQFATALPAAREGEAMAMYGYEEKVYTSENAGFEMYGNKGTDGLLYADRTPLPNYYELQHNYARAFVADSTLAADGSRLTLHISNRYDFLNLKDNVTFHWTYSEDRDTLAHGAFSPDCAPRAAVQYTLALPTLPNPSRIALLHLTLTDAQGITFLRQSIPIAPTDLTPRLLKGLDKAASDPLALLQEGIMVRAGRKATLAETVQVGDKRLKRYLLPLAADSTSELTNDYLAASILEYMGIDHSEFGYSYNDIISGNLHIDRIFNPFSWKVGGRFKKLSIYRVTGDARDFSNWRETDNNN
jgi:hypothetical protein